MKKIFEKFSLSHEVVIRLLLVVLTFLLFDLFWCIQTTFRAFSYPETYINALTVSLILLLPYIFTRQDWCFFPIVFILDLLLISNLMYNRTYNSAIPLNSYLIANNLTDFMSSVVASIRWFDFLLPLLIIPFFFMRKKSKEHSWRKGYWYCFVISVAVSLCLLLFQGGLVKAIKSKKTVNDYMCITPEYTIFGGMLYDALTNKTHISDEDAAEIKEYLNKHVALSPLTDTLSVRKNLVLVLCESLESWVLEKKVEGIEITPNLNRALRQPTTLYAPYVLSQVKGGRSMDCQLMVNAGLLPVESGAWSLLYPKNHFFTLNQAMKEGWNTRSWLLTADKPTIWNQQAVALAFGFDQAMYRQDWELEEASGPRNNIGDAALMRQAVNRMQKGEVWPHGTHAFIQFVTYSGHHPFKLPEDLHRIHLRKNYPDMLRDYLVTANYTDYAIGHLLDYLYSRPDYNETMIVIIGDHEGLASDRESLCTAQEGKGLVSDKTFVPLIIINAPKAMRYNAVMGQIDIYPTLLHLLNLNHYVWKGVGKSILDFDKLPVAVAPDYHVEGKTTAIPSNAIEHLQKAYSISDKIIRFNFLKQGNLHTPKNQTTD
ncbi:MAG: LTA synthase family protein [Prevotella sp.]|nr:LTA synthase family protein [Prevotella sp.]